MGLGNFQQKYYEGFDYAPSAPSIKVTRIGFNKSKTIRKTLSKGVKSFYIHPDDFHHVRFPYIVRLNEVGNTLAFVCKHERDEDGDDIPFVMDMSSHQSPIWVDAKTFATKRKHAIDNVFLSDTYVVHDNYTTSYLKNKGDVIRVIRCIEDGVVRTYQRKYNRCGPKSKPFTSKSLVMDVLVTEPIYHVPRQFDGDGNMVAKVPSRFVTLGSPLEKDVMGLPKSLTGKPSIQPSSSYEIRKMMVKRGYSSYYEKQISLNEYNRLLASGDMYSFDTIPINEQEW